MHMGREERKYSYTKFHENPFSGIRAVFADGRTDITKLIVSHRNFADVTKVNKI